jgi:hypothetical protein
MRIGKNLSDAYPVQNGLKQRNALLPLPFNFALEYAIRKVKQNQDYIISWYLMLMLTY